MANVISGKNTLKSGFIYAVVILMLSSFWARVLGIVWLSDSIYAISLVVIVLKYFSAPLTKSSATTVFLLLLTIISLISGWVQGIPSDVDYYLHAGITTCVFMCLDMCANRTIQMSEASKKKILWVFIVSGLFLEIYYYFGGLKNARIAPGHPSASLNLDNPNEAGLWMAGFVIILVGSVFVLKGWERIAAIGVSVFLFPILSATNSRNSVYAAVLFAVMVVMIRMVRVLSIRKVPKIILFIMAVLPVIVFFFYMYVIVPNMDQWNLMFETSTSTALEKGWDSRESLWQDLLDDLPRCFWIGDYAKYYIGQWHNSLMTLYGRYGVFYLAGAVVVIYQALKRTQENLSIYATLGLCGLLFTGCFEGSLFVGVAGLYLILLVVPVLLGDYSSKQ